MNLGRLPQAISLRPLTLADADALHTVLGDPDVMRFSHSGLKTPDETRGFVAWAVEDYARYGHGLLAVVENRTAQVVGYCGFFRYALRGKPLLELSYRLHPAVQGQGYATAAATWARDWGFNALDQSRIVSLIDPANRASIRVAEKIGMHHAETLSLADGRPVHLYAINRENSLASVSAGGAVPAPAHTNPLPP